MADSREFGEGRKRDGRASDLSRDAIASQLGRKAGGIGSLAARAQHRINRKSMIYSDIVIQYLVSGIEAQLMHIISTGW